MAKRSKTQRAKASARRAEKRMVTDEPLVESQDGSEGERGGASAAKKDASRASRDEVVLKKAEKKPVKKEPGRIATFFRGVRSELARVTWPTRIDVIRWSGVVVGALLFFGVFVFVLDNIFPQLLVLLDAANSTGA